MGDYYFEFDRGFVGWRNFVRDAQAIPEKGGKLPIVPISFKAKFQAPREPDDSNRQCGQVLGQ